LSRPPWCIKLRTMTRADPQLKLRLPLELKERIEHEAATNKRSMNAEIVARLQESLSPARRTATLEDAIKIFQAEAEKMGAKFQLVFEKKE
jgi:hypothetical protein